MLSYKNLIEAKLNKNQTDPIVIATELLEKYEAKASSSTNRLLVDRLPHQVLCNKLRTVLHASNNIPEVITLFFDELNKSKEEKFSTDNEFIFLLNDFLNYFPEYRHLIRRFDLQTLCKQDFTWVDQLFETTLNNAMKQMNDPAISDNTADTIAATLRVIPPDLKDDAITILNRFMHIPAPLHSLTKMFDVMETKTKTNVIDNYHRLLDSDTGRRDHFYQALPCMYLHASDTQRRAFQTTLSGVLRKREDKEQLHAIRLYHALAKSQDIDEKTRNTAVCHALTLLDCTILIPESRDYRQRINRYALTTIACGRSELPSDVLTTHIDKLTTLMICSPTRPTILSEAFANLLNLISPEAAAEICCAVFSETPTNHPDAKKIIGVVDRLTNNEANKITIQMCKQSPHLFTPFFQEAENAMISCEKESPKEFADRFKQSTAILIAKLLAEAIPQEYINRIAQKIISIRFPAKHTAVTEHFAFLQAVLNNPHLSNKLRIQLVMLRRELISAIPEKALPNNIALTQSETSDEIMREWLKNLTDEKLDVTLKSEIQKRFLLQLISDPILSPALWISYYHQFLNLISLDANLAKTHETLAQQLQPRYIRLCDIVHRNDNLLFNLDVSTIKNFNDNIFTETFCSEFTNPQQTLKDKLIKRLLMTVLTLPMPKLHLLHKMICIHLCNDLIYALDIASPTQRLAIISCFMTLLTDRNYGELLQGAAYQAIKHIAPQLNCNEQIALIREVRARNHHPELTDLLPILLEANIKRRALETKISVATDYAVNAREIVIRYCG